MSGGEGRLLWSVAVVACLSLAVQRTEAQWAGDALTNPGQIKGPNPISCQCSDAAPRASIYYNVSYSCLQQRSFGACDQDFTKNAQIKEIPEGWCQVTCGRCACCKTVADVAQSNNLNTLLSAARIAGLSAQFSAPASMFTLLAPTDDAFTKALPTLGFDSLDAIPASTLNTLLLYHIIPPHAGIDAVWTTPFFTASDGASIDTAVPNAGLTFTSAAGNLTIKGDSNSATILKADVEACKSFINTIDTVLIPPKNAGPANLPVNAGNINATFGPAPTAAQQEANLVAEGPIQSAGR